MALRGILISLSCLKLIYDLFTIWLNERQREKPLPDEVADIYDAQRYEQYLDYKKENKKLFFTRQLIMLFLDIVFILFTDFFAWIERLVGVNVYLIFFATYLCVFVINEIISIGINYYDTFVIEERFGLNKKDKKEFVKEQCIDGIIEFVMMIVIMGCLIFVCEHLDGWTNHFRISYLQSFFICFGLCCAFFLLMLLVSLLGVLAMKLQYQFTPLPKGELRSAIEEVLKGCKKKIRQIYVYNESKKSTSKNAFLLRILGYREISIADNFINENDYRELLAVLSHEIGHLRHKKNIYNYLNYGIVLVLFCLFVWLLPNIEVVKAYIQWVQVSFNLSNINYYVQVMVFSSLLSPLLALLNIYHNFVSRREEYEADRYAVSLGYGNELIKTFKTLSSDEFVNVNPAYLVEVLEYDHPGMCRRIKAILDGMKG